VVGVSTPMAPLTHEQSIPLMDDRHPHACQQAARRCGSQATAGQLHAARARAAGLGGAAHTTRPPSIRLALATVGGPQSAGSCARCDAASVSSASCHRGQRVPCPLRRGRRLGPAPRGLPRAAGKRRTSKESSSLPAHLFALLLADSMRPRPRGTHHSRARPVAVTRLGHHATGY
jgi:hypothetical protein